MRIFISGGCKNGKSTHAQTLAVNQRQQGKKLYYLATMLPHDSEDRERVARHRQERRGMGFTTLEQPVGMGELIGSIDPEDSVLLDSVTALLSNEMFPGKEPDMTAPERVERELSGLIRHLSDLVIVSDYIYSDAWQYDSMTESYRRGLAMLDRRCAQLCDTVIEVCCGGIVVHKGTVPGTK